MSKNKSTTSPTWGQLMAKWRACKNGDKGASYSHPKVGLVVPQHNPWHLYWVKEEINLHDNRRVFPDWGDMGVRYASEQRRDHKAERQKHKARAAAQKKEYRQRPEVKARNAERMRLKRQDPAVKLQHNLSKRMWDVMMGAKAGRSIRRYIGCTPEELRTHIENQFWIGMSWDNYGEWHVDHIMPCASFDHSKEADIKKCWHYTNLQPLWAKDNISKHARTDWTLK